MTASERPLKIFCRAVHCPERTGSSMSYHVCKMISAPSKYKTDTKSPNISSTRSCDQSHPSVRSATKAPSLSIFRINLYVVLIYRWGEGLREVKLSLWVSKRPASSLLLSFIFSRIMVVSGSEANHADGWQNNGDTAMVGVSFFLCIAHTSSGSHLCS